MLSGANTWHLYRKVLRESGLRYLAKGCALMALMRLRQNRQDFSAQAPLISNVRALFAVIAHHFTSGAVISWVLPCLNVLHSLERTAAELRPPVWLLLGRSTFATYHLFTTLQHSLGTAGVNLLDRSSDEWRAYYAHWRQAWIRAGLPLASLFLNKTRIARLWSLRPRGEPWQPTV